MLPVCHAHKHAVCLQSVTYSHGTCYLYAMLSVFHAQEHAVCLQGVTYSHRTCYLYAMLMSMPDGMSLSSSSCIYCMVPMYHAMGWGVPFSAPMVLPGQLTVVSSVYIGTYMASLWSSLYSACTSAACNYVGCMVTVLGLCTVG